MNTGYIALGSNVGDRLDHLRSGKEALAHSVSVLGVSPVYNTTPIDTVEGGRFLNAVVAVSTSLSPEALLSLCLDIEEANGRIRKYRNSPRTLDVDLLLYGDLVIDTPRLTIPHPRMHERAFVLAPLADIAPDVPHPVLGASIRRLFEQCGSQRLVFRTDYSL